MKKDKIIWEKFSESYKYKVFCVTSSPSKTKKILRQIKPGAILDLGCGPVTFLLKELLKRRDVIVAASDFSRSMLIEAQRKMQSPYLMYVEADNRELPFKKNTLDTIISINSILPEKRLDIDPMISEIFRVLKVGGRLLAVFPAFEMSLIAKEHWGVEIKLDESNHQEYDTTGWQSFYTKKDIENLLSKYSPKSVQIESMYFRSEVEIKYIRKIYGEKIDKKILRKYPLFEHFVWVEK